MTSFSMRDTGTRLLLVGRTRLAASMLGRAVAAHPSDPAARHNLALALRAQGDHQAALEHAEASVAQQATPEGLTLVGHLRLLCGDPTGGEAALQQAAAQDHGPARYLLGVLWSPSRPTEAAASLRAALDRPLPGPLRAQIAQHLLDLEAHGKAGSLEQCTLPLSAEIRAAPPDTAPTRGAKAPISSEPLTPSQLAAQLMQSRCVVALTGAGLSEASGPRRRRPLWDQFHRDEAVSVWRFRENPVYLWSVISGFLDGPEATPGAAHRALASLPIAAVVTQNIDGLHQQAGSQEVIELHGSFARTRCDQCGRAYRVPVQGYLGGPLPPRCVCGGPIRPDAVLFGEPAPQAATEAAEAWLSRADLLLVIGCAMDVAPASEMPRRAAASGARVVELSRGPSKLGRTMSLSRLIGPFEETLPAVLAACRQKGSKH